MDNIEVNFVSREEIVDRYLDKVLNGYVLTEDDRDFLKDMAKK